MADVKAAAQRAHDWLVAHPKRHTTGALAKTWAGRPCYPDHPDAYCFCAVGRLARELGVRSYGDVQALIPDVHGLWVANDTYKPYALELLLEIARV